MDKLELAKQKRARRAGKSTATKYSKWNASPDGEKFRETWVKSSNLKMSEEISEEEISEETSEDEAEEKE